MADKLTKRPLPSDVFNGQLPFVPPPGHDPLAPEETALRQSHKQSQRLELYDRYMSLPLAQKFRMLYLSESEVREAFIGLYHQYETLVARLQEIIGAQNETINALVEGLAELEARVPKPQAEEQLDLELSTTEH